MFLIDESSLKNHDIYAYKNLIMDRQRKLLPINQTDIVIKYMPVNEISVNY